MREECKQPLFDALPHAEADGQLRELWHSAFGDGKDYINQFFSIYKADSVAHTLSVGRQVVSALYVLPFNLCVAGDSVPAAYIYAVATLAEFRGRGYMRTLMSNVEELLRNRGMVYVFLLPASDELRNYYARLGYTDCSKRDINVFIPSSGITVTGDLLQISSVDSIFSLWCSWQKRTAPVVIHTRELLLLNISSCEMQGGGCFMLMHGAQPVAAAFVIKDAAGILLLDINGCNERVCDELKSLLCRHFGVDSMRYLLSGSGQNLCMGRVLDKYSTIPMSFNVSLMLDK